MSRFRIRTLKVRLIVSIFVIITAVYALIGMTLLLTYHSDLVIIEGLYQGGRFGMLMMLIIFFIISVITGLIVFYRFNQIFLKPINELSTACKQVEKGNYDVEVKADVRNRELRRLMNAFNRMTKEISSVELLKKDFISYFSHEFKTPIASIRGFSRQLKERELDPNKQKEYIDIIDRESDRLIKMSSNVLTLTKLEHHATLTDTKRFSLDEQLRRTRLVLEKQWTEKDLELVLELDEIEIVSNEEMIKQVWVNVIGNGINYSHHGGKLKIQCKKDGKFAKVRIRDYGAGMSDRVREHIFEKFYQGDASHGASGNGLGMSIVKRILDLCGGRIVIKSQVKKGTVVIVYLPL
jgi:signal transduction histidine kinase